MSLVVGQIAAVLGLDDGSYRAGLEEAQKAAWDFGGKLQKMGSYMTAGVTLPLVAFGAKAVQIFAEQEQAEAALAQALGKTGAAAQQALEPMREFASQIQAQTLYGDEAVLKGMALAANMGVQKDQLQDTAKAAAGLAAAYGLDLQTAFQLLGKAAAGNTAALGRYGIIVDENASKEEKFQQILRLGVSKFGAAEAAANTATGKIEQMRMAIGDMVESIGAAIAPALVPLANAIKGVANAIGGLPGPARTAIVVFGGIMAAIGPLLVMIGTMIRSWMLIVQVAPMVGTAWTVAMGPVGWVIAAIAAVAAGAYLIIKNWGSIKAFFGGIWEHLKAGFGALKTFFADVWQSIYDNTIGRVKAIVDFIKRYFKGIWSLFSNLIGGKSVDLLGTANYIVHGGPAPGSGSDEQTRILREIRDGQREQTRAMKPMPATH